jgi:hypothetical protein
VLKLKLNHVCVKSLCEGEPKLDHIVRILSPSADDQMCITAQELLQNRLLIERLDKLGHCKEAFLLKTLGDDYQAWDCPGLSRAEREYRHKGERKALTALLGERLNLVKGLTVSHFEGFSRQLIMEELTNIDAHEQYLLHVPGLGDVMVEDSTAPTTSRGSSVCWCSAAASSPPRRSRWASCATRTSSCA